MDVGDVRVCVLRIEGTNCEQEMHECFKRLGAQPELVHLKQLLGQDVTREERRELADFHCLMIPGGFSSGDYIRAGAILAARMKSALRYQLVEFVKRGCPVGGVCNGFQVLVEMGMLPGLASTMTEAPEAALTTNESGRFECRPTYLRHESSGKCVFTSKIPKGKVLQIPCAHAEGKLLFPPEKQEEMMAELEAGDQVVFRFVDPEGNLAGYPWNPNGSPGNIAGICNKKGNVFGMMPHPERVFYRYQDPDWTRRGGPKGAGGGRAIFESVLDYICARF
ncbi:MAG: phosphoribosylformylglycinamidine synthase subunit PurQ [Thermoplasmatota archaeon]